MPLNPWQAIDPSAPTPVLPSAGEQAAKRVEAGIERLEDDEAPGPPSHALGRDPGGGALGRL